jgi:hypothetical protein
MIRHRAASILAALLLAGLALVGAGPAHASVPLLRGGMKITNSDGSGCSISFADPLEVWLIYTAAHCYDAGISPEVSVGRYRVGVYRPDLVYDTKLDVVAIQLYDGFLSSYSVCDELACYPFAAPRTPKIGDVVCKFGAVTRQTCGPITKLWSDEFSMKLPVRHGDSGGPVYQIDAGGFAHLVGLTTGQSRRDRTNAYATMITSVADLLKRTWGSTWRMD